MERIVGASDVAWLAGPDAEFNFDLCGPRQLSGRRSVGPIPPFPAVNMVQVSPANLGGSLYVTAACLGLQSQALRRNRQRRQRLRRGHLPVRRRPRARTAGRPVRRWCGGRAGQRRHRRRAVSDHLHGERPAVGHLRGRLLGGRPGGAEHRSGRKRGPLPEPGADERRPAGLPVPPALPPGRERPGRPRHHQDPQRHPPARGQRARRRGQLGPGARTLDHRPQRGPRPPERDQRHRRRPPSR